MRVTKHHMGLLAWAVTLWVGVYFIPQFFHEPVNFTTQSVESSKNPITEEEAQAWISDDPVCSDICKNPRAPVFQLKVCKCCGNDICEKERKEDVLGTDQYCKEDCEVVK
jgi:hypothetical protein